MADWVVSFVRSIIGLVANGVADVLLSLKHQVSGVTDGLVNELSSWGDEGREVGAGLYDVWDMYLVGTDMDFTIGFEPTSLFTWFKTYLRNLQRDEGMSWLCTENLQWDHIGRFTTHYPRCSVFHEDTSEAETFFNEVLSQGSAGPVNWSLDALAHLTPYDWLILGLISFVMFCFFVVTLHWHKTTPKTRSDFHPELTAALNRRTKRWGGIFNIMWVCRRLMSVVVRKSVLFFFIALYKLIHDLPLAVMPGVISIVRTLVTKLFVWLVKVTPWLLRRLWRVAVAIVTLVVTEYRRTPTSNGHRATQGITLISKRVRSARLKPMRDRTRHRLRDGGCAIAELYDELASLACDVLAGALRELKEAAIKEANIRRYRYERRFYATLERVGGVSLVGFVRAEVSRTKAELASLRRAVREALVAIFVGDRSPARHVRYVIYFALWLCSQIILGCYVAWFCVLWVAALRFVMRDQISAVLIWWTALAPVVIWLVFAFVLTPMLLCKTKRGTRPLLAGAHLFIADTLLFMAEIRRRACWDYGRLVGLSRLMFEDDDRPVLELARQVMSHVDESLSAVTIILQVLTVLWLIYVCGSFSLAMGKTRWTGPWRLYSVVFAYASCVVITAISLICAVRFIPISTLLTNSYWWWDPTGNRTIKTMRGGARIGGGLPRLGPEYWSWRAKIKFVPDYPNTWSRRPSPWSRLPEYAHRSSGMRLRLPDLRRPATTNWVRWHDAPYGGRGRREALRYFEGLRLRESGITGTSPRSTPPQRSSVPTAVAQQSAFEVRRDGSVGRRNPRYIW